MCQTLGIVLKLSEFVFWAYKLDLSDSRVFTLENRCVCAHFERHFKGIETDKIYRVVIKLSEDDQRNGMTEWSSSVLKYYDSFDFDYYHGLKDREKKTHLLDTLGASLLRVCELMGWDTEPFIQARQKVIDDNFDNSYEVSKKHNRSRSFVAILKASHTEKDFILSVVVNDKRGHKILERQLFSVEPDEFTFKSLVGTIKWSANDVLVYCAKDKTVIETIYISSNG